MLLSAAVLAAELLRPAFTADAPGALGSPAWRNAVHEQFEKTDAYVLADGAYVYVAFSAQTADRDPGDSVKVFLWSDKAAYAFSVDASGAPSAAGSHQTPQWNSNEQTNPQGYSVIMRFPRALFSAAGSRWLVQFARVVPSQHLAYTWPASSGEAGNVIYSVAFDASQAGGPFTAAKTHREEPAVTVPAGAKGIALAQTQDSVALAGSAAQTADGTQHTSASIRWTSPDEHASAGIERVASSDRDATAITQTASAAYDNQDNLRFSAGVSSDGGTNVTDTSQATYDYYDFSVYGKNRTLEMRWNAAGPQYNPSDENAPAPGTAGYTLSLSQAFGNISLDASANRYRDDLGNLSDANERAAISAALSPVLTFNVDAAANAATLGGAVPYAQSGAQLQYAENGRQAGLSYHEDHFSGGDARAASASARVPIPILGTLQLARSQTTVAGTIAGIVPQQSSSASLAHRFDRGYVSLGYQNADGAANFTFSFEDRLPLGLLKASYFNPTTPFSSPNFTLKLIRL